METEHILHWAWGEYSFTFKEEFEVIHMKKSTHYLGTGLSCCYSRFNYLIPLCLSSLCGDTYYTNCMW